MHSQSWLLSRIRACGYEFNVEGACQAFSAKASEAILLGDMATFNRRIALIKAYEPAALNEAMLTAETRRTEIVAEMKREAIRELKLELAENKSEIEVEEKKFEQSLSSLQRKKLAQHIQEKIEKKMAEQPLAFRDILTMRGFFDSLTVHQTVPGYLFESYPEEEKSHIFAKTIFELTRPVMLEKQGGVAVDDVPFCGAYSHSELCSFFQTLSVALTDFTHPIALILHCGGHVITIGYDPGTHNWNFTDANSKPPVKIDLTIEALSKEVMTGFFTRPLTAFMTNIFTSPMTESKNLNERLVRWKSALEWKTIHAVTPEKIKYYNPANNSNLLFLAINVHDIELTKKLLIGGANPNVGYMQSCLLSALNKSLPPEIIQMLLERGADPNAKFHNWTSIYFALVGKYPAHTIKLLLDAGADPNAKFQNWTLINYALFKKYPAHTIKLLLDAGADPNKTDAQGFTPLMIAAEAGATAAVPLFLKKDVWLNAAALGSADVLLNFAKKKHRQVELQTLLGPAATEIPGMTALHLAVFFGHTEIVRQLLNAGADPYLNTHQGISNLQFAEAMGHAEIIEIYMNLLRSKIQSLAERTLLAKGVRYESLQKLVELSTAEEVKFGTLETTFTDFQKLENIVGSLLAATNFLATPATRAEMQPIIDMSYHAFLAEYPASTSIEKIIGDLLGQVKLIQDKLEKALPAKGYFSRLFPPKGQTLVDSLKKITDKQELKQSTTAPKSRI